MAQSDLFTALDSLWTKKDVGTTPPFFVMHRFLASNPDLAVAARYLQREIRDHDMMLAVWRGLLPKGRGAPRLQYVAPKKRPEEDALTARMMQVTNERRNVVEDQITLFSKLGREKELYTYFGVEPPK